MYPIAVLVGILAAHAFGFFFLGMRIPGSREDLVSRPLVRIHLPDGSVLRFLPVYDHQGRVPFLLAEKELQVCDWNSLFPDQRKTGTGSAALSLKEARTFAAGLSARCGRRIELPNADEWQLAATQLHGAIPSVWGWGPVPQDLRFATDSGAGIPRGFIAFGGFENLAGGQWEWLADGRAAGSAWSELDPRTLQVTYRVQFPPGYADRDAGARLLLRP